MATTSGSFAAKRSIGNTSINKLMSLILAAVLLAALTVLHTAGPTRIWYDERLTAFEPTAVVKFSAAGTRS